MDVLLILISLDALIAMDLTIVTSPVVAMVTKEKSQKLKEKELAYALTTYDINITV